jgi:putative ABC transport system permease protein
MMLREITDAIRSLRAARGATTVALILLTVGIGASTAVFSVVNAVLRGLPFENADRLVTISETNPRTGDSLQVTAPNFLDWKTRQDVFEDLAATSDRGSNLVLQGADRPESLETLRATASLFTVLRVQPQLGRPFTAENEVSGSHRVVLLSDALWRRRFGADPGVIGRTMTFETGAYEIVGVMPRDFAYPIAAIRPADIYVPYVVSASQRVRGTSLSFALQVIGRMKPDVTLAGARARMQQIHEGLVAQSPSWFQGRGIAVSDLRESVIGPARSWMLLLAGAVGFVLLIVFINVSGLLLARGGSRVREIGIRAALGATQWRIARGLVVESVLLSAAGACCGVAVAYGGVAVLRAAVPATLPLVGPIAVDARVLAGAAVSALAAAVLCGLLPALRFSRGDVALALHQRGPSSDSAPRTGRASMCLIVAEVGLAVMLLVGAGLFASSFIRLMRVDLGLDYRNVLTVPAHVSFDFRDPSARTRAIERAAVMMPAVIERTRMIPGVEAVAAVVGGLPLSGSSIRSSLTIRGRERQVTDEVVDIHEVTTDYFQALRIPLLQGRVFSKVDSKMATPVVILSEAAARRYFPDGNPLGATVEIMGSRTVIGVVGSLRLDGPERPVRPETYIPFAQGTSSGGDLVIRTRVDPASVAPAVKAVIWSIEPGALIPRTPTLEMGLQRRIAPRKFNMLIFSVFGILAIAIAATGIYGLLAQQVEQRAHEIGVRMALGAGPSQILRLVMRRAVLYLASGLAIGIVGAWNLVRFAEGFLFQVRPHDVTVHVAVGLILIAAGLCATYIPARRATRIDPLVILKES